jgi:hypothetical protein
VKFADHVKSCLSLCQIHVMSKHAGAEPHYKPPQAKGLPTKNRKKNLKKNIENIILPLFFKKFVVLAPPKPKSWLRPWKHVYKIV